MPQRLLYVGNFVPAHSTENEVRRAFAALGWTVDTVQEDELVRAAQRGTRMTALRRRALSADLVLHTMTQGTYPHPEVVVDLWRACAAAGVPTASLHLDLFYGLTAPKVRGLRRDQLPAHHPMFKVAHVFTADGGHAERWAADGVHHHWLPPAVSHTECIDVDPVMDDRAEVPDFVRPILDDAMAGRYLVGFAGSDEYHAEWPHRPHLVAWLRREYGDRFLHVGGTSTPRITGLALNRVLAAVPVWVGDSCCTAPEFPYWSDRVPETWGRGGFLIHPRVEALSEHYAHYHLPGSTWVAGDWGALREEIEFYLDPPGLLYWELRKVLADHTRRYDTYVQRAETIIATCLGEGAVCECCGRPL